MIRLFYIYFALLNIFIILLTCEGGEGFTLQDGERSHHSRPGARGGGESTMKIQDTFNQAKV